MAVCNEFKGKRMSYLADRQLCVQLSEKENFDVAPTSRTSTPGGSGSRFGRGGRGGGRGGYAGNSSRGRGGRGRKRKAAPQSSNPRASGSGYANPDPAWGGGGQAAAKRPKFQGGQQRRPKLMALPKPL